MKYKRSSGIILHPTSLPGPDGIGDLGPESFRWVDFLSETGCHLWQVLPLGPTGYGDSPYQCFSAFAGNPILVSPALIMEKGLLARIDLADRPEFPGDKVDFGNVITWKLKLLDRAFEKFLKSSRKSLLEDFTAFREAQSQWIEDFALFMAIKEAYGGGSWEHWPPELRSRLPEDIESFEKNNSRAIQKHIFRQFLFFQQWDALHKYANQKGIRIIGDVPIFVAYDSADVWSHPELFFINKKGLPTVVAGVPPDYYSPTGQLWGNPLYRWSVHKKTGYNWWIQRMKSALQLFDIVRLDHFRGFAGYWEVRNGKPTAEIGRWVPGPGDSLFKAIQKELGELPIIAEDLGVITPDVVALRDEFEFPGMKIFQFAFWTGPDDPFFPHNYPVNCVAYTGTHDNDTTVGWFASAPENERDLCRRYLARPGIDIAWDVIRAVWSSVAMMALAPMQDFLSLGKEARMNFPSRASGNWSWRILPGAITPELTGRIKEINYLYSR
ncbi:MAG TPA: 4-alpha-glucanotransferase [Anaerolineaceae bacterium]|nr:4-alpha-glucanotransferase [Anaerolineaceae bacterium]